ncbi:CHRD domain-containing protein [Candidatus Poribacteria bacterium]|nr:CHRD domain-containing protein [Candidatus Poribacteria bacterium]
MRSQLSLDAKPVGVLIIAFAVLTAFLSGIASSQSLSQVPIPEPANLGDFIRDRNVAFVLGKALYWDMQVGSDGVQACASCHFAAGADGRRGKNQLSPGLPAGDQTFQIGGPNHVLNIADFPFHKLADPDNRFSELLSDSNDVSSSQGVFLHDFVGITPGNSTDIGTPLADPVFNVGGVTIRRVEPRNTPTVINAVFNFTNFWDGRANNIFNGVNPFGPSDTLNGVFVNNNGVLEEESVRLENSSLASQAVGPPLSDFEMSFAGRTFADLGKKMFSLQPLAKQLVHPLDSALGSFSNATTDSRGRATGQRGLNVTYTELIQAAFQPKYWNNTTQILTFSNKATSANVATAGEPRRFQLANGIPRIMARPKRPLQAGEFTQMEANFSLFFGLALQMYESTLVSDDTPFDRFTLGDTTALTAQEQEGLRIFNGQGKCFNCHRGPEFTNHAVSGILGQVIGPQAIDLVAGLFGDQEVPPVQTSASGSALVAITPLRESIIFDLQVQNIRDITGAHIHVGAANENGPVIFTLSRADFTGLLTGTLTTADFIPAGGLATFDQALDAMIAGNTYVNVRTLTRRAGEIRGQLLLDIPNFQATMNGAQVAPPVSTTGSGLADLTINPAIRTIDFRLDVSNIADLEGAHVHSGLPGENGPAIFELTSGAFGSPLIGAVGLDDLIPAPGIANFNDVINAMNNGSLYVDVHSATHPDGEVRGQILPLPPGSVRPIELMTMAVGRAFYDDGMYNIGVRPSEEDLGRGGSDPFGFPLSFAELAMMKDDGLLPPELARFVPNLPAGQSNPPDRVNRDGAFKVPGLRNLELTPPYFHNGGAATIRQVVDFYDRGGDFHDENIDDLDPDINELNLTDAQKDALVAFMLALTDERVKDESAPFDHPQLFVPNGAKGDETLISGDCDVIGLGGFRQCERVMQIPAIGQYGRTWAGYAPLQSVVDQFQE